MTSSSPPPPSGGGGGSGTKNTTTKASSVSFATSTVSDTIPSAAAVAAAADATTTTTTTTTTGSPFLDALAHRRVTAKVMDLDHYRIHGGMAVETDYIVHVQQQSISTKTKTTTTAKEDVVPQLTEEEPPEFFDSFLLSKTFSAFRTMAQQLKKAADAWTAAASASPGTGTSTSNPDDAMKVAKYCELISQLVESQKTQYMGKVNYRYVKVLAKNRTSLINSVLQATCSNYVPPPPPPSSKDRKVLRLNDRHHDAALMAQVASIIETFFLTDHCSSSEEPVVATAATTTAHSGGGGSSKHNLLGTAAMLEKIVTTVEDGVAAAAQKTKELTRVGSSDSAAGGHHHRTGTSNNPLGWLPFMDNNKDNKDKKDGKKDGGATAATVATANDGSSSAAGGIPRGSGCGSVVVPLTTKDRRSETLRAHDEEELSSIHDSVRLLLDDDDGDGNNRDRPSVAFNKSTKSYTRSSQPVVLPCSSKIGKFMNSANQPIVLLCIGAATIALLRQASLSKVIIDADMALLVVFACYCLGLHTPRPMDDNKPLHMLVKSGTTVVEDRSGRKLLARSMKAQRRQSLSATTMAAAHSPGGGGGTAASTSIAAASSAHGNDNDVDDDDCDDDDDDPSASGTGDGEIMGSPMSMFPVEAKIGSVTNCWGFSDHEDFQVRGATYLSDKQKVASDEYLFPVRGVDLFLTDTCPENVGANAGIFGGHMRSLPTLLINFRLPWGVLIFYFEIPTKFVSYLQMGYEPDNDDMTPDKKAQLMQELNIMTPGERCAARFLMKDQSHKNQTFKIIPYVVNGPWVVRQVVGGKPALIGNKLPISWVYQSAEKNTTTGGEQKACYLEADLDIAASSAARSILSVARTYCQVLTLDLGFVVQGNTEDELPEQMLVGCRLHGIDPLTSPSFPMSSHDNPLFDVGNSGDGSDDESSHFGRTG